MVATAIYSVTMVLWKLLLLWEPADAQREGYFRRDMHPAPLEQWASPVFAVVAYATNST